MRVDGWNLEGVNTHMDVRVKQRRGLVFALLANGATQTRVAETLGVGRERVRQIVAIMEWRIFREADRRFPPFVRRWEQA